jgi:hypothetical protein
MTKRARKVVAGIEDGKWWLTTYFEYGSSCDDVEWKGFDEYEIPTEDRAFEYLRERYRSSVIFNNCTKFEYAETHLPVGTLVNGIPRSVCAEEPPVGKVEVVCGIWRRVRYELSALYKRLSGRETTSGWYSVFELGEKRGR